MQQLKLREPGTWLQSPYAAAAAAQLLVAAAGSAQASCLRSTCTYAWSKINRYQFIVRWLTNTHWQDALPTLPWPMTWTS